MKAPSATGHFLPESSGAPRFALAASAALALVIHAVVLFVIPRPRAYEAPEFGVAAGETAVEVTLVAAPEAPAAAVPDSAAGEPPVPEEVQPEVVPDPPAMEPEEPMVEPVPEPVAVPRPTPRATPAAKAAERPGPSPARPSSSPASSSGQPSVGTPGPRAGGRPGSASAKPGYLHNPHPSYPELSRRAGHQGVVLLRVSVNERGRVTAVSLLKSSGYEMLDERARSAVQKWIFKPARVDGTAIATQVDVPVRFSLDR